MPLNAMLPLFEELKAGLFVKVPLFLLLEISIQVFPLPE
jgi:hypothetical protein